MEGVLNQSNKISKALRHHSKLNTVLQKATLQNNQFNLSFGLMFHAYVFAYIFCDFVFDSANDPNKS